MKTNKLNLVVTFTFMLLFTANSFAQFTLKGEFRNRTEYNVSKAGVNTLVAEDTDGYLSSWQRSRIIAHYKKGKLETKFSFQDVRAFGSNIYVDSTNQNTKLWQSNNGATLAVHEAWAKYYFTDNIGLKIGRQQLKLGDGRLIWHKDWNHYGGAYDAFSLEGKLEKLSWVAGFSLNSVDDRDNYVAYKNLGFAHVSAKIADALTINFTDLYEGNETDITDYTATPDASSDYEAIYRNSVGVNPIIKVGPIVLNSSFYYQLGKQTVDIDFAAMMGTTNIKFKLNEKFALNAGFDYYSGEAYNDDQTDNKNKTFSVPFASGHKFFGNTDFQLKMFGQKRGAQDIYFKVDANLSKKLSIMLGFHAISYAEKHNYINADLENIEFTSVGNDIDLQIKLGLDKGAALIAGYSVMLPSDDYANSVPKVGVGVSPKFHQFAWLMFKFTPTFLKTKAEKEIPKENELPKQ